MNRCVLGSHTPTRHASRGLSSPHQPSDIPELVQKIRRAQTVQKSGAVSPHPTNCLTFQGSCRESEEHEQFSSAALSILSTFMLALGEYDYDELFFRRCYQRRLADLMLVLFCLVVPVIFLNLLVSECSPLRARTEASHSLSHPPIHSPLTHSPTRPSLIHLLLTHSLAHSPLAHSLTPHSLTRPLAPRSFTYSLTHSLAPRSFTPPSLTQSFAPSLVHPLTHSSTRSPTHSLIHSPTRSPTHSPLAHSHTRSLTHSLAPRSFTHPLTRSRTH